MKIHCLIHVAFEMPGSMLDWTEQKGYAVTYTHFWRGDALPEQMDFDWLIVMGGPMNIYEYEKYPWLAGETAFIQQAVTAGKVVLGFCLGAQLICAALGGKVTKNAEPEIGWFPVKMTDAAKQIHALVDFPAEPVVFQWHGDTFSTLPEGAVLFAESPVCAHEGFCYENRVFAFQFHMENTPEILHNLVENCADELVDAPYVQSAVEILSQPAQVQACNALMGKFLSRLEQIH